MISVGTQERAQNGPGINCQESMSCHLETFYFSFFFHLNIVFFLLVHYFFTPSIIFMEYLLSGRHTAGQLWLCLLYYSHFQRRNRAQHHLANLYIILPSSWVWAILAATSKRLFIYIYGGLVSRCIFFSCLSIKVRGSEMRAVTDRRRRGNFGCSHAGISQSHPRLPWHTKFLRMSRVSFWPLYSS